MRDEKAARETLTTHEREEEEKQEMEPRESEIKGCSIVLEMRDGAKRGGIRAEGSGYCGSNSLETSQLDWYPGNQQADSAPHAHIQGWGGQRERGGEAGGEGVNAGRGTCLCLFMCPQM